MPDLNSHQDLFIRNLSAKDLRIDYMVKEKEGFHLIHNGFGSLGAENIEACPWSVEPRGPEVKIKGLTCLQEHHSCLTTRADPRSLKAQIPI